MDSNKDEAERCIDVAMQHLKRGNIPRAEVFARKAVNLYPTERAKNLLATLETQKSTGPTAANGNGTPTKRAPPSQQPEPKERDYTDAQLEMVRRIKRCKDYYEVLQISRTCTDSDIKKAYKKLALQLHPDKNRAPGAVEAFKSVGNAVAVLTDAQKRKAYDMYGAEGQHQQQHQQHQHNGQHHRGEPNFFESEFTADEMFNMFFGGGAFPQHQRQQQNRAQRQYAAGNQEARQPSMAFGLILVLIIISMLSSFFTADPVYSLSASTRYPIRRHTVNLNVQYYVKEKFDTEYQGSLARLEKSVEEEYVAVMKQNCYRERNYREMMIGRAKSYGSQAYFKQAQDLKMPSCENLARMGLHKYMTY